MVQKRYGIYYKIFENDHLLLYNDLAGYGSGTKVVAKATSATSATYSSTANYAKSAPTMKGATTAAAGSAGLVPAPAKSYNTRFLRGDGTWADPVLSGVGTVRYNESTDMIQVYTGSGWVDWKSGFNSGYVYNNGTYDNTPEIGYLSSSYNSFAINSNHIYLKRESGATSTCNMVFTNPVNLTKYSKLILKSNLKITRSDNITNLVLGVSPTAIGSTTVESGCSKYKISTDVNSTSYVLTSVELNISDITGNYYVYIQLNVSIVQSGTYGEAQILEVYMI